MGLSAGVSQMSAALVHAPEGEFDDAGVCTGAIAGWHPKPMSPGSHDHRNVNRVKSSMSKSNHS